MIKTFKPTTPGRRKMTALVNAEITKTTPEKSLTFTLKKNSGRNNSGKITVSSTRISSWNKNIIRRNC